MRTRGHLTLSSLQSLPVTVLLAHSASEWTPVWPCMACGVFIPWTECVCFVFLPVPTWDEEEIGEKTGKKIM